MAKQNITKLLERIERYSDRAADFFEERGFNKEADILNGAAQHAQDLREQIESLKEAA